MPEGEVTSRQDGGTHRPKVFQEYFIKIPEVSRRQVFFQEFPGPGKLKNQIPGLSRSCTSPVIIIIIIIIIIVCLSVTMDCGKTADWGRKVSEEVNMKWTRIIHVDWVRSFSDARFKRWRGGV
jgi:hypothetical protein